MVADTLAGRLIAVPESRELDVFAGLLERRGARIVLMRVVGVLVPVAGQHGRPVSEHLDKRVEEDV